MINRVCEQLDLVEKDYFGLRYVDNKRQRVCIYYDFFFNKEYYLIIIILAQIYYNFIKKYILCHQSYSNCVSLLKFKYQWQILKFVQGYGDVLHFLIFVL